MSDDRVSKPNGSGTDPMQRLASLKPVRDLSLGAAKPNKKVFLPNLNVARNKSKGSNSSSSLGSKKEDRNRRDRKNERNKNFRGPNIIKSSGVFSEGLGNAERHSSRISFGREADAKPSMPKPTIRVKDFVKIDKELEEQKIRSAMGEGDANSSGYLDGPSIDFKTTTDRDAPIKLPMDNGCWSEPLPTVKVKQEVIIKTEPEDFEPFIAKERPVGIKREPCEETEVVNLLNRKEPTLILLQLPDTLPGRGGGREEEAPRRKRSHNEPSTSQEEADEKPVDNRCHLSDLEEGRIGMMRTHRSGRVTLLVGDTVFEVNMGTKAAFHQEVISVSCDATSRSAALVSLGPLQHKLSVVPSWETMFKDLAT